MEKFAGVSQKLANLEVSFQLVKLLDLQLKSKQTNPTKQLLYFLFIFKGSNRINELTYFYRMLLQ